MKGAGSLLYMCTRFCLNLACRCLCKFYVGNEFFFVGMTNLSMLYPSVQIFWLDWVLLQLLEF